MFDKQLTSDISDLLVVKIYIFVHRSTRDNFAVIFFVSFKFLM